MGTDRGCWNRKSTWNKIPWGDNRWQNFLEISHICTKLLRSISVLAKAHHFLFCSLILPYFTYCTEVWGITYKNSLQPIFILQKRAIRIIHKVDFLEHTNPLFYTSKIIKFHDIVEFQTAKFMDKIRNKTANPLTKHILCKRGRL